MEVFLYANNNESERERTLFMKKVVLIQKTTFWPAISDRGNKMKVQSYIINNRHLNTLKAMKYSFTPYISPFILLLSPILPHVQLGAFPDFYVL